MAGSYGRFAPDRRVHGSVKMIAPARQCQSSISHAQSESYRAFENDGGNVQILRAQAPKCFQGSGQDATVTARNTMASVVNYAASGTQALDEQDDTQQAWPSRADASMKLAGRDNDQSSLIERMPVYPHLWSPATSSNRQLPLEGTVGNSGHGTSTTMVTETAEVDYADEPSFLADRYFPEVSITKRA